MNSVSRITEKLVIYIYTNSIPSNAILFYPRKYIAGAIRFQYGGGGGVGGVDGRGEKGVVWVAGGWGRGGGAGGVRGGGSKTRMGS